MHSLGFHIGKPLKISNLVDLSRKKLVMNLSGGASVLASPNQSFRAQLIGRVFPYISLTISKLGVLGIVFFYSE